MECFVCGRNVNDHGGWVKYHISYTPPIWIWACKSCNYLEYLLRSKIDPETRNFKNTKDRRNKINELRKLRNLDRI